MGRWVLVAFLLVLGCQKAPKDPCTRFEGWAMTIPYRITIGKQLNVSEKKKAEAAIQKTFREVDEIFNNWNPRSEISRFNASQANQPFALSVPLRELLLFCRQIVDLSSGRFDPAIAPLLQLWKSSLKERKIPSAEALQAACDVSGWGHLTLQQDFLAKDRAETSLDLCSVSKGLCVDWLVERLRDAGHPDLLVEWGGEIRALGTHPTGRLWAVQIDPGLVMDGKPIPPLTLKNGAIATSGDAGQKEWTLPSSASPDGQTHFFFHILDPFTAQPLEKTQYSVASVSVIAPTCLLADALATAAMVFTSKQEVEKWAQEVTTLYPEVSFWILCYDPNRTVTHAKNDLL